MAQAPCKDCKERELGCHSKCEKYLAFKLERDKEQEQIRKIKETNYMPPKKRR